jgi:hypothetical protein
MIGGVLLQRKKYQLTDYLASGLLSLGLIIFTLAGLHLTTAVPLDISSLHVHSVCSLVCTKKSGSNHAPLCGRLFTSDGSFVPHLATLLSAQDQIYLRLYPLIPVSVLIVFFVVFFTLFPTTAR